MRSLRSPSFFRPAKIILVLRRRTTAADGTTRARARKWTTQPHVCLHAPRDLLGGVQEVVEQRLLTPHDAAGLVGGRVGEALGRAGCAAEQAVQVRPLLVAGALLHGVALRAPARGDGEARDKAVARGRCASQSSDTPPPRCPHLVLKISAWQRGAVRGAYASRRGGRRRGRTHWHPSRRRPWCWLLRRWPAKRRKRRRSVGASANVRHQPAAARQRPCAAIPPSRTIAASERQRQPGRNRTRGGARHHR